MHLIHVGAVQGQHPEIVQQAQEIVRVRHGFGRETAFERPRDAAVLHNLLEDGGVMGELLVPADQHPDLRVVGPDVVVDHVHRNLAALVDVLVHEVEDHVRIEQRRLADALRGETVVVIPGSHDFDEFIHGMVELRGRGIVFQHLPHLRLGESDHPVEPVVVRIIGSDVEPGGQVVHRHGAHARDIDAPDGTGGSILDGVIERPQGPVPMRLRLVVVHSGRIRQDGVREVVVLVDEKVHLPAGLRDHLAKAGQKLRRILAGHDKFLGFRKQDIPIRIAKALDHGGADVVHPAHIPFDAAAHRRET